MTTPRSLDATDCGTCGEIDGAEGECPKSLRPCGHHCNHSWENGCCWCGWEPGERAPEGMEAVTSQPAREWIFTFGSGQRLRSTSSSGRIGVTSTDAFPTLPLGLPLHNRYVAITAPTQPEARALMVAVFGDLWSMEYSSRERAGVDEYGLVELDISEALAELAKEQR